VITDDPRVRCAVVALGWAIGLISLLVILASLAP